MRWIATLVLSGLTSLAAISPTTAFAANEVAVEPTTASPGQTVTLHWYFTGSKVLLSGGRFGKGLIVTGRQSISDHPTKTTRYTFDVWYKPGPAPTQTVGQAGKLLHVQYSALAEIGVSATAPMSAYRDPHGWQINIISGWKHDNVPTPDEGSDGLIFFQKEDDSVERMAVAIMPAGKMTADDVLKKVSADVYSHYDSATISDPVSMTYENAPAQWVTFTGIDQTHPGTKTTSVVLAFVRDGRAYVVSARTQASSFKSRQALLEKMVKSFAFNKKVTLDL